METKDKFEEVVNSYMDALSNAIYNKDFFGYAKALGVLEYLGMPDIEYHTSFAFHMNEEFQKSADFFEKVPKQSAMYPMALQGLAIDYSRLGRYLELERVLSSESFICSPLEELQYRIQCLQHTEYSYFHEHAEELKTLSFTDVPAGEYKGNDAITFFNICRTLVIGLVVAGECINQCSLYQSRLGNEIVAIEEIKELKRFSEEYERQCRILELSKYLKIFRLPENIRSLAECALHDKPWNQKIGIFQSTNYVQQILQIIHTICSPEIHKCIAAYEPVEQILEAFIHIEPRAVAQVVDHYFEVISKAYSEGVSSVAQYLGYVYSEILAIGRDPYNLKDRIDALRNNDDVDFGAGAPRIKLVRSMSRNGYDAYINAQDSFAKTQNIVQGSRDYSALSLQFFRVLEIEYCEKLIIPLSKMIDIDTALDWADQSDEEWKCKSWKYDIKCLEKIKNGDQKSFEVGAIRTMLGHIVGWKTQNDPCAEYLRPLIENLLTNEGKNALHNKEMLNVIGNAELEKYRIPGAHTGFLPYSTACESKEYVEENLQKVVSWFK